MHTNAEEKMSAGGIEGFPCYTLHPELLPGETPAQGLSLPLSSTNLMGVSTDVLETRDILAGSHLAGALAGLAMVICIAAAVKVVGPGPGSVFMTRV